MKAQGIYNPALSIQIETLATYVWQLGQLRETMKEAEFEPFIEKQTRDGMQLIEHPIYKVLDRIVASITRQMKQLNMTVDVLVGSPDIPDEGDRILEEMQQI